MTCGKRFWSVTATIAASVMLLVGASDPSPGTRQIGDEPDASLCPGCHARVHRTKAMLSAVPPLLLELWREQHPKGHEQVQLDFTSRRPAAKLILLFGEEQEAVCY